MANFYPPQKHCTLALGFVVVVAAAMALGGSCSRVLDDSAMVARHEQWMARHGRVYANEQEKQRRFQIFKDTVAFVEAHNNGADKGYTLAVTEFADMTNEEFRASYTGYKNRPSSSSSSTSASFRYADVSQLPEEVDWRKQGVVTPVKNQYRCGCCWAFSAVAAVEGAVMLKTGQLMSLSEQELVDCDTQRNLGCGGGLMTEAFQFIQRYGLNSESNYPYMARQGMCDAQKASSPVTTISGNENVPRNDEMALMQAVAQQPVSVAIEGSGRYFQMYGSGVFDGSYCGTELTHAVTIIGYGTTMEGTKYWLIKNSWGASWGENGYMRILRDGPNTQGSCGLAKQPSYPVA